MSREDHAKVDRVSDGVQREEKNIRITALTTASTVSFSMQVSVNNSDHGYVVRIFVGPL